MSGNKGNKQIDFNIAKTKSSDDWAGIKGNKQIDFLEVIISLR